MSRSNWFVRLSVTLLCCMGLSGCLGPTPYIKTLPENDSLGFPLVFGYTDKQVNGDLYRVTFVGNNRTPSRVIYAYALLRSAELTQELGLQWFEIVEGPIDRTVVTDDRKLSHLEGSRYAKQDTAFAPSSDSDVDITPPTSVQRMMRKSAYIPIYVPDGNYTPRSASLLIRVQKEKPADASRAFDAMVTRDALRAKITSPAD